MESQFLSLFEVSIAFEESHLFFPRIVSWVLVGLLAIILLSKSNRIAPALRRAGQAVTQGGDGFDRKRFFGTILLIVIYFYMMAVVGDIFPNTGFGFLFVSIPFIFLLSMLYVEHSTRKNILIIAVTAAIAPTLAWYVLSQLFRITLP
ncbi:tripartite tricarboxylate transporter TctB family protein [Halomonas sp. McH1-25]|uniref:tripartite tricarboxylate transporter TctB family protein n=1 Tax=unclassified Halomonas TaxID=2609666 RepID=UPI001EF6AA99|nr:MULTISPECIES: tripartite tricarboxylate transporter TctB family protein [unclassified Halomonas]MCG7599188.1 tripartite tricarboxylate transporter TctB family protein [Halomonas sp. McH1-25]MCP1341056.1 tripartite tricarboxylate transporter TctB family protein [Halomonas sp. FL8]MCP1362632.1 tripartite tricarboxylate transporter TctB family protein [Halomonas sp. BBD45]MCP1364361.1 tripartite tricarboxylate transporter TctB family protein [Halomonas sp. BBD48]